GAVPVVLSRRVGLQPLRLGPVCCQGSQCRDWLLPAAQRAQAVAVCPLRDRSSSLSRPWAARVAAYWRIGWLGSRSPKATWRKPRPCLASPSVLAPPFTTSSSFREPPLPRATRSWRSCRSRATLIACWRLSLLRRLVLYNAGWSRGTRRR